MMSRQNHSPAHCPSIYVVIVTYNGEHWIRPLLDSLKQSSVRHTVIAVDNGSIDDTASIVESEYADVLLLRMRRNLGFGRANNIGMALALEQGADHILLLNQDALVTPQTLELLCSAQMENPEFGLLSPVHLDYSGTHVDEPFLYYIHSQMEILNDLLLDQAKALYEVDVINAAIWLLSRTTIERVGGFDPLFFHGGEDDDYRSRLRFHKIRMGFVPTARAYHSHESFGHHTAKTEAWQQNSAYNRALLKLKRLEYPFYWNVAALAKQSLFSIVRDMCCLRVMPAVRTIRTLSRIVGSLGSIRCNRSLSAQEGLHWITCCSEVSIGANRAE